MKRSMYFNTVAEMEAYFPDGVPSKVLAIVQSSAEEPAIMFTSSNNSPVDPGQSESQGGYVDSPEDLSLSEEILYGTVNV